jgi:hypothetical protein
VTRMNRAYRRMLQFGKRFSSDRKAGRGVSGPDQRDVAGSQPDVSSPRAKNQRHGKVTADKWNQ